MKQSFLGYYSDTPADIDLEIPATRVVFDTNVLLNLYRYPSNASEDLLRLMETLGDKVWLPYQAALEFHRNRLTVISDQNRKFREVRRIIDRALDGLEKELADLQLRKRHSTIDPSRFLKKLHAEKDTFERLLSAQESKHPDVTDNDQIRGRLASIFDTRIGASPADQEWLDSIFADGLKRYEANIPPGYRDLPKQGEIFTHCGLIYKREFGDLILWKQLVEHCKASEIKQLIFVTDDDKEDWWLIVDSGGKKRLGPRPELIEELKGMSQVERFCLLNSDQFAQRVSAILGLELGADTVQQVRDVRSTLSTQERIKCPNCGLIGTESLGVQIGSSAFHICGGCGTRFHVHRASDGQVITREWGASTRQPGLARSRVEAVCPKCQQIVPANLTEDEESTERYCMTCCSLLTIDAKGEVIESHSSYPEESAAVTYEGHSIYLTCPKCEGVKPTRIIWRNDSILRAVCSQCHSLLEASVPNQDQT